MKFSDMLGPILGLALLVQPARAQDSGVPEVQQLVTRMEQGWGQEQRDAIARLAELNARDQASRIAAFLNNQSWETRVAAIRALERFGAAEFAGAVAEQLTNTTPAVRQAALQALGTLNARSFAANVEERLFDANPEVQAQAARILKGWGVDDALRQRLVDRIRPELESYLRDRSATLAFATASEVVRLFDLRALVPVAGRYLTLDTGWDRLRAAELFARIPAPEVAADLVPLLADEFQPVREKAEEALRLAGITEDQYSRFADRADRLVPALTNYDAGVRLRAVEVLGLLGARQFASNIAALATDSDLWVRAKVAEALGRLGVAELRPTLQALANDPSEFVRAKASEALSGGAAAPGRSPSSTGWLIEHLAQEARVLEELAARLGKTIPLEAGQPLTRFIRDFVLAPADAREVTVTEDLIDKAVAVHRYKARDYYFPGAMVLLKTYTGNYGIDIGFVEEVSGNDVRVRYNNELRTYTRQELHELNAPRFSPPGNPVTFVDVRIDPVNDPLIQPMLETTRQIVDRLMPEFVAALQRGDMVRATQIQSDAFVRIYNDAVRGDSMGGGWYDPPVSAGQAWSQRKGACHTRAGVLFSALQAELLPRMGVIPQLHVRNPTLNGDGLGHSWAGSRLASGGWIYSALTWAAGNVAQGFAPDARHINGELLNHIRTYGFNQIMGVKLDLPAGNARGYSNRFVENLVRAKAEGRSLEEAVREVSAKYPYEGGEAALRAALSASTAQQPNRSASLRAKARSEAKAHALGAGAFGAAYLVKEAASGALERDPSRLARAVDSVKAQEFWVSFGIFSAGATAANKALAVGPVQQRIPRKVAKATKMGVPLFVGMAASEAAAGHVDGEALARNAAGFFGVSYGMSFAMAGPWKSVMAIPGTPGKLAKAGLAVGELSAVLFTAEKLDERVMKPAMDRLKGHANR